MSQADYYSCSAVTSEGLSFHVSSSMTSLKLPIYDSSFPKAVFPFLMAAAQLSVSSSAIYLASET